MAYTSKVTIESLNKILNNFKDLQFIVILVNAHTKVEAGISETVERNYLDYMVSMILL